MRHVFAREDAQHRHHGAHRRRQDHDDRAHPLLHREDAQDRRGARRRGRHGLDGAGAGARHHHHVGGDHLSTGATCDQHHRHARARGLHHGGRAQPARARRRHRAVLLGRRRRAAVRDRLAPGRQVRHPAHRLHQQDGPHRRRLLPRPRDDGRPPRRATPWRCRSRSAARPTSAASSTSSTMQRHASDRRARHGLRDVTDIPDDLGSSPTTTAQR